MQSFKIRPIEKDDNAAVANIIRKVMPEFDCVGEGYSINDPEVDTMFEAYDNNKSAFYVIENENNNNILGCGGIAPLKNAEDYICELQKMYFLKDLRGYGMGQKLLDVCLGQASEIGYKKCYLETIAKMGAANNLYKKNKFQKLSAPIGNTGHSGCDSYYSKNLDTKKPFANLLKGK